MQHPTECLPTINGYDTLDAPASDMVGTAWQNVITGFRRHKPLRRPSRKRVEDLVSANRRKDEFLAVVSHELRSPLASIQNAIHYLNKDADENPARQRMQALLERQVRRMTRLVDELGDISRIVNGRMYLQFERVDLRAVVNHAIEALAQDINARDHALTTALPATPVWLRADPSRLEQVFVNLIANAVKYTDTGGKLSVWIHTRDGEAVIRIRDSGIGIAPQALPHVFDLFKQANAGDPRSKSGLGIGLAVVRNLVELHDGTVTAASGGAGQGSEFTIRLPREDQDD